MIRVRQLITALVLGLALATTGVALEATAIAKTHHKKAAKHRANKRSTAKSRTHGAKGDKGDKGDQGPKGDKGDKGDPATSVVARARLGAPTSTGDGGDVDVPLTDNVWTAAPDEADDFAGVVTVTAPSACDAQSSSIVDDPTSPIFGSEDWPGAVDIDVTLDGGNVIGWAYRAFQDGDGGKSFSVPISFQSRALAGDSPTTHTLGVHAFDECAADGQSYTITDLHINAYGMH